MTNAPKAIWISVLAAALVPAMGLTLAASGYAAAQDEQRGEKNRIKVKKQAGADFGEKLTSCIRQLGPAGGTCDARFISGSQTVKADPFAGSDGRIKVLLGNVTIETSQAWGLPNKTELAGEGRNTVLRVAPGANSGLIVNAGRKNGNNGIFIHDLTLDGNNARNTGAVSTIHLRAVSDFAIERVTVTNSVVHGIILDDGCVRGKVWNSHIENVKVGSGILAGNTPPAARVSFLEIHGNKISNVARADGIFVLGADANGEHTHDVNISDNIITGVKDTSIEVGDGARKVTVERNTIMLAKAPGGSSGATGISMRSAQDVRLSGNTVSGDPGEHDQAGLLVWSPAEDKGGSLSEVTIDNNTVSDVGGYGIKVHSGGGIHLIRNTVRHSTQSNIYVTQKATGVTQQDNTVQ